LKAYSANWRAGYASPHSLPAALPYLLQSVRAMTIDRRPIPDDAPLLEHSPLPGQILDLPGYGCFHIDDDGIRRIGPLPHQKVMTLRLDGVALEEQGIDAWNCRRTGAQDSLFRQPVNRHGLKHGVATSIDRQRLISA